MDIALVQDLSDLASRLRREYTVEGLKEITATLEKVSQRLEATPALRKRLGATPLPSILTKLVVARPSLDNPNEAFFQFRLMVANVAQVVKWLVTDCEENADRLFKAGYPAMTMEILMNAATNLPTEAWRQELLPSFVNLIPSLLLLVMSKHPAILAALSTQKNFSGLCKLASTAYTPAEWSSPDHEPRARLARYLWNIARLIAGADGSRCVLQAQDLKYVASAMRFFVPPHQPPAPPNLSSLSAEASSLKFGFELGILTEATQTVATFRDPSRLDPAIVRDQELVDFFFDFEERAAIPTWFDTSSWTTQTSQAVPQIISNSRSGVSTVIALLASVPDMPVWYWQRVGSRLNNEDLVDSALAAFGNAVNSDATAQLMLQPPSQFADAISTLLKPSSPKRVQHSLLGLLRNLAIPAANVPLLGTPVIDGILSLRPWESENDEPPMETMQRNALHIMRNLSRSPELAARFLASEVALLDITMLYMRTPKLGLKGLILDTVGSALRVLPSPATSPSPDVAKAWEVCATDTVMTLMVTSVVGGLDEPSILANGLAALRNTVQNGPATAIPEITVALTRSVPTSALVGADTIADVIAPPVSRPEGFPPDVQADAVAVVAAIASPEVTAKVKAAVERNLREGRPVAAGV